jgi:hypothetical protein
VNGNDGHKLGADHFGLVVEYNAEPADLRPLGRLLLSLAGHQLPSVDLRHRDRDASGSELGGVQIQSDRHSITAAVLDQGDDH